ncbi:DUF2723 domain-containing protein [Pyxidicoccus fallax]|uniref:DUF2723 domain-containing protein n=1 Tax=Pyxidicoccus fallax TaxID=394095 RepID=A0A848LY71_9BACT|nr:DUF2723 domain-containing protein [Pyxidicoccus fallax]NPC83754.1 DUF2723 domain-containing protein [Pyxidicoccus fallax]
MRGWAPALSAAGVLLLVYLRTLLPGVGFADTAKFQFVGWVLGTPHATGYPNYLVLNHLFLKAVPFGTLAWRANLLSAVFAVAAVLVMSRLLVALGVRAGVAALVALAFGLTPTLWSQALAAEVYTLNLLFVAGVTLFFVRWRQTGARRFFYAACGLYALSFGCHLTMITLLPAIVVWVWTTERRVFWDVRAVCAVLGLIVLGASQYAYIFWRTHSPDTIYSEMRAGNLSEFWWSITGAQFKSLMFMFTPRQFLTERVPMYLGLLWKNLWPFLPLVPVGLLTLWRQRGPWSFLLLGALGNAAYALNYGIWDIFVYFIPGYFFLTVLAGVGLESLLDRWRSAPRWAGVAVALLPALALGAVNFREVDQSKERRAENFLHDTLKVVGTDALIVTRMYDESETLWYALFGEGLGEARRILLLYDHPRMEDVAAYVRDGAPLSAHVRPVPPGTRVFTIDADKAEELRGLGLQTAVRGERIWEVLPPAP